MQEEWKNVNLIFTDIFSKYYEVSCHGKIRNKKTKRLLSQNLRNGYYSVCLYDPETDKKKTVNVHRIVAETFLSNPLENVNHINGNKMDNNLSNLEWVTSQQNARHALTNGLLKPHTRKVNQFSLDGDFIATFDSITDASTKTNTNSKRISDVCKGKRKTTNNFKWEYVDNDNVIENVVGKEIQGYPNYLITESGEIYSKRLKKFLIQKKSKNGYYLVKLCNNGKMTDAYVNKLFREYYQKDLLVHTHLEKSDGIFGEIP